MSTVLESPPVCVARDDSGLRAGECISSSARARIRHRVVLESCKWDPQVGDEDTLTPFPLILKRAVWNQLADWSEKLSDESVAAEEEIIRRPKLLLGRLGFPRPLRRAFEGNGPFTPAAGRVVRYDFHFTTDGWQISEANSDVPGGFTEASFFSTLMAEQFPVLKLAGNPGEVWADTLTETIGAGVVALLTAPGLMEDHQVVAYLASQLSLRGLETIIAKPEQIHWQDGIAHLETASWRGALAGLVRFYQAEWLARLPRATGWQHFFRGGRTPVANPALAVISESKRFPLTWDSLATPLPTWRALLPDTRDPREIPSLDDHWILKTAMCNNGEAVGVRSWMHPRRWLKFRFESALFPSYWVAQRRFSSVPLPTPLGPRHACVGVYTINGEAAGAYARLSPGPLIDHLAADVALLLENDD